MRRVLSVIVLGLFLSQNSFANDKSIIDNSTYLGLGIVYSDIDYNARGNSISYSRVYPKFLVGHRTNNVSFEFQHIHFSGDADIEVYGGGRRLAEISADIDGSSSGIAALYHFDSGFFLKLGFHDWEAEFPDIAFTKTDDTDPFAGFGYEIISENDKNWKAVRLEYEYMEFGGEIDDSMDSIGLSFVLGF